MVNFVADNKTSLENKEALLKIKKFFYEELPNFELSEEFDSESNYNGFRIQYVNKGNIIVLSSSWRGMEHEILINDKVFSLLNFEPQMREILSCSITNLNFTLVVLKRFIDEQNTIV